MSEGLVDSFLNAMKISGINQIDLSKKLNEAAKAKLEDALKTFIYEYEYSKTLESFCYNSDPQSKGKMLDEIVAHSILNYSDGMVSLLQLKEIPRFTTVEKKRSKPKFDSFLNQKPVGEIVLPPEHIIAPGPDVMCFLSETELLVIACKCSPTGEHVPRSQILHSLSSLQFRVKKNKIVFGTEKTYYTIKGIRKVYKIVVCLPSYLVDILPKKSTTTKFDEDENEDEDEDSDTKDYEVEVLGATVTQWNYKEFFSPKYADILEQGIIEIGNIENNKEYMRKFKVREEIKCCDKLRLDPSFTEAKYYNKAHLHEYLKVKKISYKKNDKIKDLETIILKELNKN